MRVLRRGGSGRRVGRVLVEKRRYGAVDRSAGGCQAGEVLDGGNLRAGASTGEVGYPSRTSDPAELAESKKREQDTLG